MVRKRGVPGALVAIVNTWGVLDILKVKLPSVPIVYLYTTQDAWPLEVSCRSNYHAITDPNGTNENNQYPHQYQLAE